jgi:hypothetical protein
MPPRRPHLQAKWTIPSRQCRGSGSTGNPPLRQGPGNDDRMRKNASPLFLGEPTIDETQTAWSESGSCHDEQDSMIESKQPKAKLQTPARLRLICWLTAAEILLWDPRTRLQMLHSSFAEADARAGRISRCAP